MTDNTDLSTARAEELALATRGTANFHQSIQLLQLVHLV